MIGIVDYGAGNLLSLANALEWCGASSRLVRAADEADGVDALILPGVGAFGWAMARLGERGLDARLRAWALEERRPLLGVCLGQQLLARRGSEGGGADGLGLLPLEVDALAAAPDVRIPHVGWNDVEVVRPGVLLAGLNAPVCYFVHSYAILLSDESAPFGSGVTRHGAAFCAVVERDNVFGTQFHPEKSQQDGLAILKNFLGYVG